MTTKYIISQGMVICAMLSLASTYLVKDKKKIMLLGLLYNSFYGIQYFLLNAMTGFAMNVVSIIRNIWFYRNDKLKKKNNIWVLIGTFILIILLGQASYQNIYTAVPMLATCIYSYSVWQDDVKVYRWLSLPMSFLWINYAFYNNSLFGFVCEIVLLIIEIIGVIKINKDFDNKKNKKRKKQNGKF